MINCPPKNQIIAIGDAMNTDIKGAKNFEIKNIFVNSGLHKNDSNFLQKFDFKPDILADRFIDIKI